MPVAALIFFLVPIIEMVILIEVGSAIGALPTIGLVVLTAVVGVWLLKMEGISTLNRVQRKLAAGELPETELLEGVMLIIGGALLLTPGFATDFIGFVCLLPGLRRPLAAKIVGSGTFSRVHTFTSRSGSFSAGSGPFANHNAQERRQGGGTTIDGEFTDQSPTSTDEQLTGPQHRHNPHENSPQDNKPQDNKPTKRGDNT